MDHLIDALPREVIKAREAGRLKSAQLDAYRDRLGLPFKQEGRLDALHGLRGELEGLLSGQGQEDARARIDAAVAAFQALKSEPEPHTAAALPAVPEPEPATPAASVVVPFPAPPQDPAPESVELLPPPEPVPGPPPRWAAKVRPDGTRRHASLFDAPRPVADAPERAEEGRTWRKAVGGKPTQLSLF